MKIRQGMTRIGAFSILLFSVFVQASEKRPRSEQSQDEQVQLLQQQAEQAIGAADFSRALKVIDRMPEEHETMRNELLEKITNAVGMLIEIGAINNESAAQFYEAVEIRKLKKPSVKRQKLDEKSLEWANSTRDEILDLIGERDFQFAFDLLESNLKYHEDLRERLYNEAIDQLIEEVESAIDLDELDHASDLLNQLPKEERLLRDEWFKKLTDAKNRVTQEPPAKRQKLDRSSAEWAESIRNEVETEMAKSNFGLVFNRIAGNLEYHEELRKTLYNEAISQLIDAVENQINVGEFDHASDLLNQLPEEKRLLRNEWFKKLADAKKIVTKEPPARCPEPSGEKDEEGQGIQSEEVRRTEEKRATRENSKLVKIGEQAEAIFENIEKVYKLLADSEKKERVIRDIMMREAGLDENVVLKEIVDEMFQNADKLKKLKQDAADRIGSIGQAAHAAQTEIAGDAYLSAQSIIKRINELHDQSEEYMRNMQ